MVVEHGTEDRHVFMYEIVQVTAVGMATEWGRLMATISEDNDEETPLQVRHNFTCPHFLHFHQDCQSFCRLPCRSLT